MRTSHKISEARLRTILNRQQPAGFGAAYVPSIRAVREEAPRNSRFQEVWFYIFDRYISTISVPERMVLHIILYCPWLFDLHEQWMLPYLPAPHPLTLGLPDVVRQITAGSFEGNPKWLTISRNQDVLNYAAQQASVNMPDMFNTECSVMPLVAFLTDHKAETLSSVLAVVEKFIAEHPTDPTLIQVLPAAGNSGIEAATNIVVREVWVKMLIYVYAAVIALCLITFRSWRATIVAVLPLVLTSILCEALMVWLGIGVKVATLPVIALGVGIGVDYALYLLSVQLAGQRRGMGLAQAYGDAVLFTGRVVALVGVTLAAGVITWAFSPIKFQADMGILLTFMFLWNMVGALVLIPALSHFLLNDRHFAKSSP